VRDDGGGLAEDLRHQADLGGLFVRVGLVDAEGVGPEVAGLGGVAQAVEGGVEGWCYFEDAWVCWSVCGVKNVDMGYKSLWVAPDVGECFILGMFVQVGFVDEAGDWIGIASR
jgi:hypothetical protein